MIYDTRNLVHLAFSTEADNCESFSAVLNGENFPIRIYGLLCYNFSNSKRGLPWNGRCTCVHTINRKFNKLYFSANVRQDSSRT